MPLWKVCLKGSALPPPIPDDFGPIVPPSFGAPTSAAADALAAEENIAEAAARMPADAARRAPLLLEEEAEGEPCSFPFSSAPAPSQLLPGSSPAALRTEVVAWLLEEAALEAAMPLHGVGREEGLTWR